MPDIAVPPAAGRTLALAGPLTMAGRCLRISRRQIDALLTSLLCR